MLAACDAAGLALVPLVAPTTPDERLARIGARARGFLYTVSVTGTTGERAALSDAFAAVVARAKAARDGAGRARLRHRDARAGRRRPPTPGADGVIVGSRLVRAAAEADDPPAAVRELVAGARAPRRCAARIAPPAMGRRPSPRTIGLVIWLVLWALGVASRSTRS